MHMHTGRHLGVRERETEKQGGATRIYHTLKLTVGPLHRFFLLRLFCISESQTAAHFTVNSYPPRGQCRRGGDANVSRERRSCPTRREEERLRRAAAEGAPAGVILEARRNRQKSKVNKHVFGVNIRSVVCFS